MAEPGSVLMAKKKGRPPKDEPDDTRVAIVVLKGSLAYRAWLAGISRDSLIPVASIVRDAVAKWAAARGYQPPPEK
jgi:hypothetical protein